MKSILFGIAIFVVVFALWLAWRARRRNAACYDAMGRNAPADACSRFNNDNDACCRNFNCVYRIAKDGTRTCVRRAGVARGRNYRDRLTASKHCTEAVAPAESRAKDTMVGASVSPVVRPATAASSNCSDSKNVQDCHDSGCSWTLEGCANFFRRSN